MTPETKPPVPFRLVYIDPANKSADRPAQIFARSHPSDTTNEWIAKMLDSGSEIGYVKVYESVEVLVKIEKRRPQEKTA